LEWEGWAVALRSKRQMKDGSVGLEQKVGRLTWKVTERAAKTARKGMVHVRLRTRQHTMRHTRRRVSKKGGSPSQEWLLSESCNDDVKNSGFAAGGESVQSQKCVLAKGCGRGS